ncbi:hypothetical protein BO85DRAFT_447338 [Aspergillus piperis CBS 112811]|uniref:Uncharacterized protein n=1 Tax=Aspergillus piperis CBS 112811 TaxID=1448313 RepID=A0A8G1R7R4_9EURO|nr:hypothetical protein BO85DRAFT_447338 [Aspergillus piperis CBS 112811]RAH60752.1 hypothetical protein BO85DRAFT_447338 [Aspergillus piperis CBS 112811]
MRFAFVFDAIGTFVLLPLSQCRPLGPSCSQLQGVDSKLDSLQDAADQVHPNDGNIFGNARLDGMRNSIESSSDLIHQKEDEECDNNSDKSDDLLDSTLSTLSGL